MVYLDNSATTRVSEEAAREAFRCMRESYGNPSSLHLFGSQAEAILKEARRSLAFALTCSPEEIVFGSGGTESDNQALIGAYMAKRREGNKIITSAVEHPAVLETMKYLEEQGADVTYVDVGEDGKVKASDFLRMVDEKTILVSLMSINNETGAVMPVEEIFRACPHVIRHTDAVQALGKIPLAHTGADLLSVSGHKIHAPKGCGALYIRRGIHLPPLIRGGGQEKGQRSGTENLPALSAFGLAARKAEEKRKERVDIMRRLRDRLLQNICDQIPDIRVNSPEDACPAILNISFLGTRAEVIVHRLEQKGIMVSTGSACSSRQGGSRVLRAMGLDQDRVASALRFSFSHENTEEEMDYTADCLAEAVSRFRRLGAFR